MEENLVKYDFILSQKVVFPNGKLHFGEGLGTLIEITSNGNFGEILLACSQEMLDLLLKEKKKVLKCHLITPGFIDIHNHGLGDSKDATEYWINPQYTCGLLPSQGTTSTLATLTFPKENPQLTRKIVQSIKEWMYHPLPRHASILGIHGEGPIVADLGGLVESKYNYFLFKLLK